MRLLHTAKVIGLSVEEFYQMNPCDFMRLCGMYQESHGGTNPYEVLFREDL